MTDDTRQTDTTSQVQSRTTDRSTPGVRISRRHALRALGAGTAASALGATVGLASAQADLPRLHVEGNEVLTADGEAVTLRGVNVVDPKRANTLAPLRGRNAEQHVDLVTGEGWHPDVIRLPVQPVDIGEHPAGMGPEPPAFDQEQLDAYLEDHLDPVLEQCAEAGVYAIVDFHRHRDIDWADEETGAINEALQAETIDFWETVAPRYADDDHVLYEVYNEPTEPGMWGHYEEGWVQEPWYQFLDFVQPIVDEIREHTDTIALVGSPGWSQSPEGALIEPVEGENLAYTYHIYPGHEASEQQNWEDSGITGHGVEGVYEEYPLFVTEFGWNPDLDDDFLSGTTEDFGQPFLEWLESHDSIHWTAWCADVDWQPAMFERGFEHDGGVDHPYEDEVPVYCEDRPCEWELLGRDAGGDDHMGEFLRLALELEGVPEGYLDLDDEPADDAADEDDEVDDDGATVDEPSADGADDADDGMPGFGLGAGAAGLAGGLGYLLKERATTVEDDSGEA